MNGQDQTLILDDPTAARWRTLFPNSDIRVVKAKLDALVPDVSSECEVHVYETGDFAMQWNAVPKNFTEDDGIPYGISFLAGDTDGVRRIDYTWCWVADRHPKGQGFGFGVLRVLADLALNNGYDSVHIPEAIDDGLTFWPRQGARLLPDGVVMGGILLRTWGEGQLTHDSNFRANSWGTLLRDKRTRGVITRLLIAVKNSYEEHQLPMVFDRASLQSVLDKPARPSPVQPVLQVVNRGSAYEPS